MKIRRLSAIAIGLALGFAVLACTAAFAQETPNGQTAPPDASEGGQRQDQNQRSGRGSFGGRAGFAPGVMGIVTEVAAEHYTVKVDAGISDAGESYTVYFSANTRILKQLAANGGKGGNPPQAIRSAEIKVGDTIAVRGEVDAAARSVGAVFIVQIAPERARELRAMQANYGKTWLQGRVTSVDGVKVTLLGVVDNTIHSLVTDENTSFRKRRQPIALAEIAVGDQVRAEGANKEGNFVATTVIVMGMPPDETPTVPRKTPLSSPPD